MPIIRIQHAVPDFDSWKQAFDADPMDRRKSGVRRYEVFRSLEDGNFVMIDLELDTRAEAENLLQRLQQLWSGPGQSVMRNPEARIIESVAAAAF